MEPQVIRITPELAQTWINNTEEAIQRKSDRRAISQLSRLMSSGKFRLNGESIIIDNKGNVIDGLHRLKACVKAEIPFESVVVAGVDQECIRTIDSGKGRSVSDNLKIHCGTTNARDVSSTIKQLFMYAQGKTGANKNRDNLLTADDAIKFLERNPHFEESISRYLSTRNRGTKLISPAIFCACYYVFENYDAQSDRAVTLVRDFMYSLATGDGNIENAKKLHSRLLNERLSGRRIKTWTPSHTLKAILWTFAKTMEGQNMERFARMSFIGPNAYKFNFYKPFGSF